MSTISLQAFQPESEAKQLKGTMSTTEIVCSVLAFNGPFSVVTGYAPVIIGVGHTLGVPLIFLLCGVLFMLFAVGFTTMGQHLENPGAFYSYITAGLGKPAGLGGAFLALLAYLCIAIGVYAFAGYTIDLFLQQTLGMPAVSSWLFALALIGLVGVLGYFKIDLSAKVLTMVLAVEMVMIFAFNISTLVTGGAEGNTLAPLSFGSLEGANIGLAVLFCIVCFGGFEAAAIFHEEAANPSKTIPRATYLSIIVMCLLYAVCSWVIVTAVGSSTVIEASLNDPAGTTLAAVGVALGKTVQGMCNALLITSLFACALSTHNVATRYVYSLSVDGVLSKTFAKVHAKQGSPYKASAIVTGISLVFTLCSFIGDVSVSKVYIAFAGIGAYALIFLMLLTGLAVIAYLHRRHDLNIGVFKCKIAPALAALGMLIALVLGSMNFAMLIDGSEGVALIVMGLLYGLFLLGVGLGMHYRKHKPSIYSCIGRQLG
ncbi:APC family permease [Pseudomonas putida]|uniref:APC family permease n=1 Tax=Pseudomonas putida TaxID=303 RepID=A0A7D6A1L0_PSEPU|nr:APC family permease [Pseudomonas putida]QLJ12581.1 APC family permease [Pseudomonas putida]